MLGGSIDLETPEGRQKVIAAFSKFSDLFDLLEAEMSGSHASSVISKLVH
jgi:hypothetical protein